MRESKLLRDMMNFRCRTGMYVHAQDSFDSISAFVSGYDLAVGGKLLDGFQEWGRVHKWQMHSAFFVTEEIRFAIESRPELQSANPISYLLDSLIEYHSSREATH